MATTFRCDPQGSNVWAASLIASMQAVTDSVDDNCRYQARCQERGNGSFHLMHLIRRL